VLKVDKNPFSSEPLDAGSESDESTLRSPIRPTPPSTERRPAPPTPAPPTTGPIASGSGPAAPPSNDPHQALNDLRRKMETVASEYSQGKINRAQFNAMYGRYSEQRVIIQRLIERNPDSKAWKQVVSTSGHTTFLRQHFEAQPLYYAVFRHQTLTPLMTGGKTQPNMAELTPILNGLWNMPTRPKAGLARKTMGENLWLVLALGEQAVTLVMFMLEPSNAQATLVRDLHNDFERANQAALVRQTARLERMVFPQRALVEENL
jgi:hypothetical protein